MRISDALRDCCHGRTLLIGLGNPMFGDDGCGVRLVEIMEKAGVSWPSLGVAGVSPERYLDTWRAFDTVIFADAVECGKPPGSVILMDGEQVVARYPQVSTHKVSLGLLSKQLAGHGVRPWLLGIQPASVSAGTGLSSAVEASVEALNRAFREIADDP